MGKRRAAAGRGAANLRRGQRLQHLGVGAVPNRVDGAGEPRARGAGDNRAQFRSRQNGNAAAGRTRVFVGAEEPRRLTSERAVDQQLDPAYPKPLIAESAPHPRAGHLFEHRNVAIDRDARAQLSPVSAFLEQTEEIDLLHRVRRRHALPQQVAECDQQFLSAGSPLLEGLALIDEGERLLLQDSRGPPARIAEDHPSGRRRRAARQAAPLEGQGIDPQRMTVSGVDGYRVPRGDGVQIEARRKGVAPVILVEPASRYPAAHRGAAYAGGDSPQGLRKSARRGEIDA